jgi:uncharacterized membrane protein
MDDFLFLVILLASIGLLMVVLAIPMIIQKVPPNSWYGVRIKETIDNPDIWYPTNTHIGYLLLIYGILVIIMSLLLPFIPGMNPDLYALMMVALLLVGIVIILIRGKRYVKTLTQEQELDDVAD